MDTRAKIAAFQELEGWYEWVADLDSQPDQGEAHLVKRLQEIISKYPDRLPQRHHPDEHEDAVCLKNMRAAQTNGSNNGRPWYPRLLEVARQAGRPDLFPAAKEEIVSDFDQTVSRVLELIKDSPEGISRRQLHTRLGGHVGGDALTSALASLQAGGVAHQRQVATGGRPAECWFPGEATEPAKESNPGRRAEVVHAAFDDLGDDASAAQVVDWARDRYPEVDLRGFNVYAVRMRRRKKVKSKAIRPVKAEPAGEAIPVDKLRALKDMVSRYGAARVREAVELFE